MIRNLTSVIACLVLILSSCADHSKLLLKADFGEDWPFRVEEGEVECLDGYVVVFNAGGKSYALNDAARLSGKYENVKDIIRPDANYPGQKIMMDLSLIEFEGLKLCDK